MFKENNNPKIAVNLTYIYIYPVYISKYKILSWTPDHSFNDSKRKILSLSCGKIYISSLLRGDSFYYLKGKF